MPISTISSSMGPKPSRYYFALGDHWLVHHEPVERTVSLHRNSVPWWSFFAPCFALPGFMVIAGLAHYLFIGNPIALAATLIPAICIGCVLYFLYRTEWVQLHRLPANLFVWKANKSIEILGETISLNSTHNIVLHYRFYQRGSAPGHGGFSELDVTVDDGLQARRINLLSQKSNWALKHARRLHQLTHIELSRRVISRDSSTSK